jgi:hypothetical protein
VGSVGTGFCVDTAIVRLAGVRAGTLADALGASASVADGATPQVIMAHQGWQASAALRACAKAWVVRLRRARESLDQISAKLKSNASAYEQVEQDVTARINQVISELGG